MTMCTSLLIYIYMCVCMEASPPDYERGDHFVSSTSVVVPSFMIELAGFLALGSPRSCCRRTALYMNGLSNVTVFVSPAEDINTNII